MLIIIIVIIIIIIVFIIIIVIFINASIIIKLILFPIIFIVIITILLSVEAIKTTKDSDEAFATEFKEVYSENFDQRRYSFSTGGFRRDPDGDDYRREVATG